MDEWRKKKLYIVNSSFFILHFLRYLAHLRHRVEPAFHDDGGRVGTQDELHLRVQASYHADELLLPLDVERSFGLVHEEYTVRTLAHEDGEQDDQHLFLARRELVGQQAFAVLIEGDVVAAAVDGLARIAEELVHQVLEEPLGTGELRSLDALLLVAVEEFDHAVAHVHLIVQIAALQQVELPVQFSVDIGVGHAGGEVAHDERTVVRADDVVGDAGSFGRVEEETHAGHLAVLHLTRGAVFQVADGAVQDGCLPHPVDTREDVDVGAQVPRHVVAVPQAVNLDAADIVGLYFHIV